MYIQWWIFHPLMMPIWYCYCTIRSFCFVVSDYLSVDTCLRIVPSAWIFPNKQCHNKNLLLQWWYRARVTADHNLFVIAIFLLIIAITIHLNVLRRKLTLFWIAFNWLHWPQLCEVAKYAYLDLIHVKL